MDPDPANSSLPSRLPQKTIFSQVFLLITFWRYHTSFSKIKSHKEVTKWQNSRNQSFSYHFFCMIEGSGSVPLTNGIGSGSRRPKSHRDLDVQLFCSYLFFFFKGVVAICHSFYIYFFSYNTLQNMIGSHHTIHTVYMMRLGQADVLWEDWEVFYGSHHISNCDEAWAGLCFIMEPVVLRLQSVAEFLAFLPNCDSNLRPTHQRL